LPWLGATVTVHVLRSLVFVAVAIWYCISRSFSVSASASGVTSTVRIKYFFACDDTGKLSAVEPVLVMLAIPLMKVASPRSLLASTLPSPSRSSLPSLSVSSYSRATDTSTPSRGVLLAGVCSTFVTFSPVSVTSSWSVLRVSCIIGTFWSPWKAVACARSSLSIVSVSGCSTIIAVVELSGNRYAPKLYPASDPSAALPARRSRSCTAPGGSGLMKSYFVSSAPSVTCGEVVAFSATS